MEGRSPMTTGEFLNILTEEALRYRPIVLTSIKRNRRMNDLSNNDFRGLKKRDQDRLQRTADAILVDFINFIGASRGVDYALYTKDISGISHRT